jgi:ligand-binding SRPBCC domain-containing protein
MELHGIKDTIRNSFIVHFLGQNSVGCKRTIGLTSKTIHGVIAIMYVMKCEQKLPLSLAESWDFFSSPKNLKLLVPEDLGFETMPDSGQDSMYAGQIILHKIRPLWPISLVWVTEITHVKELAYFIDEQRFGPYKFWHHEHHFQSIAKGVLITDLVYYELPFGLLGKMVHALKVKLQLKDIFAYRQRALESLFGKYSP